LSVETLIFSKLIVTRRRSVVVDISTSGAKLPLRIERAQFTELNKVEPHGLFYTWWRNETINATKICPPSMFSTEDSWDEGGEHAESGIVNNPLWEKTPSKVQWHSILRLSDTPSSSLFGAKSTPAPAGANTSRHISADSSSAHHDAMSTTDCPRLSEASLTPEAFGGSAAEIENAERWLRYLNQYVQHRNLRDDEALTLFKLLLTDQAQYWLHALPEDQADSFHRLQEAFMSRYTPNPLQ
jgi:hypothetical protein